MNIWKRIKNAFRKGSLFTEEGNLDTQQLIVTTIILTLITIGLIILGIRLMMTSKVQQYSFVPKLYRMMGYHGVALFVYLVDTFLVPLTIDVVWPFVVSWPAWKAILIMGIPSAIGGFSGYGIGLLINRIPKIRKWTETHIQGKNGKLVKEYGAFGVFLGGVTPIPFTTVCWLAGIIRVDWKKVLAACFASRLLRMALYYFFVVIAT
jgi:membrane protein YqaA with SNARE-associated domain